MSRAGGLITRAQAFAFAEAIAVSTTVACGDGMNVELRGTAVISDGPADGAPAPPQGSGFMPPADREPPCSGLRCQIEACEGRPKTSISGTVYDPAGTLRLYNVILYVPSEPLDPIPEGVTCGRCEGSTSGRPLAAALSRSDGSFTLENVPAGENIPLVIHIGKWRREVTIPSVASCTDNPVDADLTRLPRRQAEGSMPQIALTTGHSDALECLLRKIGIADEEFTTDAGGGRVHMFVGCDGGNGFGASSFAPELGGASFPPASDLWGAPAKLDQYDMIVFSCEGAQCESEKEPFKANIKAYADKGGKLFLGHTHFNWVAEGPDPWPTTAGWIGTGDDLPSPFTVKIDTSFEKGSSFAEWLVNVGASTSVGTLQILQGQWSVTDHNPPMTQRWIYTDENPAESSGGMGVEYMTMNTPVELAITNAEDQCGRVVYTDLHVVSTGSDDFSDQGTPFPNGCISSDLTPQEKALVFMIFDLSSCVQSDMAPVEPPPVILSD